MDRSLALRAAGVQLLAVAVLALATGLSLPHSFFEDWGWIVGPLAWMLAAAITARVLHLELRDTLAGAALAGIPSGLATAVGLHWLGAVVAIIAFGIWCGRKHSERTQTA